MRKIVAYEANDGSLHTGPEAAKRHDDADLCVPLLKELDEYLARAEAAKIHRAYGLLEFVRKTLPALEALRA